MEREIYKYLCSIGLILPENDAEMRASIKPNRDLIEENSISKTDPFKILANLEKDIKKSTDEKITNIDYFKRTVLAAEIVSQLKGDRSMGHLKLTKLIYLVQNTSGMALQTNFLKQAMGPFDPKMIRSIDSQFKKKKWFAYQKNDFPKYIPLENYGEHKTWYQTYFSDIDYIITELIEIFRKFNSDQIELIATIYACWKDAIENNQIVSEIMIVDKFHKWHPSKIEKFSKNRIVAGMKWMKEKGIYPKR